MDAYDCEEDGTCLSCASLSPSDQFRSGVPDICAVVHLCHGLQDFSTALGSSIFFVKGGLPFILVANWESSHPTASPQESISLCLKRKLVDDCVS
jgi:hypothetical protein